MKLEKIERQRHHIGRRAAVERIEGDGDQGAVGDRERHQQGGDHQHEDGDEKSGHSLLIRLRVTA